MRQLAWGLMVAAGMVGMAAASDARHDERLAMAAARIAAERVGQLRGSFDPGSTARFVEVAPKPNTLRSPAELRPGVWIDGLAIAVERKRTASPEL